MIKLTELSLGSFVFIGDNTSNFENSIDLSFSCLTFSARDTLW